MAVSFPGAALTPAPWHPKRAWQQGWPHGYCRGVPWQGRIRPGRAEGVGGSDFFYCRLRLRRKENNLSFLLYYC